MMGNTNGKNHPNAQKIEVLDLKTNITIEYASIRKAAIYLNTNHVTISNYIKSKKAYRERYIITVKAAGRSYQVPSFSFPLFLFLYKV